MKKVMKFLVGLAALLLILGWNIPSAQAWCDPGDLLCGAIVDSNMSQGHTDISDYNCSGTHWNGRAHVYRIYPTEDSLLITLQWTASNDDRLRIILLTDCDQNHCIGNGADTLAAHVIPGQDYWIIIESKRNNSVHYRLNVICSDHPLPVSMTSFDAEPTAEGVQLNWTVGSELNNVGFDVEREQPDVTPWEHLSFIEGRGTTSTEHTYGYLDRAAEPGARYTYRLIAIDMNGARYMAGSTSVNAGSGATPELATGFKLIGNYPNPFNPTTTIRFDVAESMQMSLDVFDISGRLVAELASGVFEAGSHEVNFDASAIPSGVYFARLSGAAESQLLKMVLMK